ncbi:Hypothetical protein CINCED_3A023981 [Cinara cedri]|uniref:Uncharacterized protein n=1 Tax=Cinara cedri TaxID=506608 RepID=A0A5E4M3I5_9HEMI|nr:Hypothetical protein CINCED_3A023981 [Cinara cedri]
MFCNFVTHQFIIYNIYVFIKISRIILILICVCFKLLYKGIKEQFTGFIMGCLSTTKMMRLGDCGSDLYEQQTIGTREQDEAQIPFFYPHFPDDMRV